MKINVDVEFDIRITDWNYNDNLYKPEYKRIWYVKTKLLKEEIIYFKEQIIAQLTDWHTIHSNSWQELNWETRYDFYKARETTEEEMFYFMNNVWDYKNDR